MLSTHTLSVEGEELVSVQFERASPDNNMPVEVVFQVKNPGGFGLLAVLLFLSSTRTDTRQKVTLTEEEFKQCSQVAADSLSD